MKDKPLTVADVMTHEVRTLTGDENLRYLQDSMDLHRFRHMPVVSDGRVVGVVSHRDILRASASTLMPHNGQQNEFLGRHFHAAGIMAGDVTTVRGTMKLREAAQLMGERKLGCLPVTDDDGKLIGIVTEADFVKLAARMLED